MFDFNHVVPDLQAAMRALWPDRKVVYFTDGSAVGQPMGEGPVLTEQERVQLHMVAAAIKAERDQALALMAELQAMRDRLEERRSSLGLDPGVNHREIRMLDEIAGDL